MKKIALLLAVLMALCACAFAENAVPALTAEDLKGIWNMEYVTSEGFMVQAEAYGLIVTLSLNEDGSAALDYNGEPGNPMEWRIEDGRAYLTGYNVPDEDVEMLLQEGGALEITDSIGTMIFVRPAEDAE